jgi:hypothetical protein
VGYLALTPSEYASGARRRQGALTNMPGGSEPLLKAIAHYRDHIVEAVECLFMWYWLADFCAREGILFAWKSSRPLPPHRSPRFRACPGLDNGLGDPLCTDWHRQRDHHLSLTLHPEAGQRRLQRFVGWPFGRQDHWAMHTHDSQSRLLPGDEPISRTANPVLQSIRLISSVS